jgi:hypothetical protein
MLAENHLDLNMVLLNYCDLKEVAHHASAMQRSKLS